MLSDTSINFRVYKVEFWKFYFQAYGRIVIQTAFPTGNSLKGWFFFFNPKPLKSTEAWPRKLRIINTSRSKVGTQTDKWTALSRCRTPGGTLYILVTEMMSLELLNPMSWDHFCPGLVNFSFGFNRGGGRDKRQSHGLGLSSMKPLSQ